MIQNLTPFKAITPIGGTGTARVSFGKKSNIVANSAIKVS